MATLKADGGGSDFECHIRLNEIAIVQFETKTKPDGKELFILRFFNEKEKPALTVLLHAGADGYDESAVEFYEGLRKHFGDSFKA